MSNVFSPSIIWLNALPPTAVCSTFCTSATLHVPASALFAIDGEFEVCLPFDVVDADVPHPSMVDRIFLVSSANRSSSVRSGPKILTEFSPLTPDRASITLSRMFCENFQSTPIRARCNSSLISSINSAFVRARWLLNQENKPCLFLHRRPILRLLERHEELDVVEAGRIGAVVGAADLGQDQLDLVVFLHDRRAIFTFCTVSSSETLNGNSAGDPEIALFQLGHELLAEEKQRADGCQHHQSDEAQERQPPAQANVDESDGHCASSPAPGCCPAV